MRGDEPPPAAIARPTAKAKHEAIMARSRQDLPEADKIDVTLPVEAHMGSRADLFKLPEWQDLSEDSSGNPVVWVNSYQCSNCGHEWTDTWSSQCDDRCALCDTSTSPTSADAQWVGPEGGYVLWISLPESGAPTEAELTDNTDCRIDPPPEAPPGGQTMAEHVAAAVKHPDPKSEAIWIMAQGMAKARTAGMEDNEILEALYHQTSQDEERNAIVTRAAPAWAWSLIDTAITTMLGDEGGDELAIAMTALEHASQSDGEDPISGADARKMLYGSE